MKIKSFRDLRVWQESIELAVKMYELTSKLPSDERFGLSSQLRRAAVSIASNIAEGQGRLTTGEWLQSLGRARGSLYELETQLEIVRRLEFRDEAALDAVNAAASRVARSLAGLIDYVAARKRELASAHRQPTTDNRQPVT